MRTSWMLSIVLAVLCAFAAPAAQADEVVVGVNLVNAPQNLTAPEQEAILGALQSAGVRVIRAGLPNTDNAIAFAERVHAHGIKIELLVGLDYAGTPWPHPPVGFSGLWRLPGLSRSDPDLFRTNFASLLGKLEAKGIGISAFELGNEINWAGFNADFSLPGRGRVLDLNDLTNDPEGQLVAKGLGQYLKSMAVLKDIRDHSKLNEHTPILSAGLADLSGTGWTQTVKADAVSIDATLVFLRANGLDRLVDGYGLHSYPSVKSPGTAEGAADRLSHLKQNGLSQCQSSGTANGKPCWFTEWGFSDVGDACPVDDAARTKLVREMKSVFVSLAQQGRLGGELFYTWEGNVHAAKEDHASAFRCGGLTSSGKLAVSPLP